MARRRRKPSFFKALVHDFSNQLEIPPAFYVHFAGEVPRRSLLRTPAGTWNVNVEKVNDGFFFQKGWKEFVHDHGLKLCEFLIFRYAGNSKFDVDVYGRNGCEKEFVMAVSKNDRSLEEGHDNAIHGTQNVDGQGFGSADGTTTSQATCAIKNEVIDVESDTSMDIDEPDTQEDQLNEDSEIGLPRELGSTEHFYSKTQMENPSEALEAAKKFSSKHPFFRAIMRKAYVDKGRLVIPKSFQASCIGKKKYVRLQDSKRRWIVKCISRRNSSRLSAGWYQFVRDRALKVGDVCVFELIDRNDAVMKVSIFRCNS
ncbi:PREDICTED: B3 [Prunus dulcis]|uniref:PREDICTED: B3 n=1 Tax=Prunus dulcis TaxID=3755 RepID=A0A5E4E3Q5_PRUDU|nr:putative B3 domain-containing protein Os03g0621600 [Prunus dulcis]VVA09619.1 PREDICTED: B3 [Prunus dulcis]